MGSLCDDKVVPLQTEGIFRGKFLGKYAFAYLHHLLIWMVEPSSCKALDLF